MGIFGKSGGKSGGKHAGKGQGPPGPLAGKAAKETKKAEAEVKKARRSGMPVREIEEARANLERLQRREAHLKKRGL